MKGKMKRAGAVLLSLAVAMGLGMGVTPAGDTPEVSQAKVKTVKKNFTVLEGSHRMIPGSYRYDKKYNTCKIKVKDTAVVTCELNPTFPKETRLCENPIDGVIVDGISVGTTTVTLKPKGKKKKIIYTVTVLPLATAQTEAAAALQDLVNEAAAKEGSVYANVDLNSDAVPDLFVDGSIYLYNYYTGKIVTHKTSFGAKKLTGISVSPTYHTAFFNLSFPATGGAVSASAVNVSADSPAAGSGVNAPVEKEVNYFKGTTVADFIVFEPGNLFKKQSEIEIMKYKYPKMFVENYVKGKDYYLFHDSHYDQDDYWFEPYTAEEMQKSINEILPDAVSVYP